MTSSGFKCIFCGSHEAQPWLKECSDFYLRKNDPVDYVECCGCSLVQQFPMPADIQALYADYPVHTSRNALQRLARRIFHQQVYFHPASGAERMTLLDFGCGDGTFLNEVKSRVGEVVGFEPGAAHAETLTERCGFPVYSSLQALCKERAGTIDVITAHYVLEHLSDLRGAFDAFQTLLKKNGTLYIAVPNIRSWEARLFKTYWHGLDAPRHLVFPEGEHFESLAASYGLTITRRSFAAFPNTLSGSLATVLTGYCNPVLLLGFTLPCWLIALAAPSGTQVVEMKKGTEK
ncbi:MAG: class I SAM-dependent methyltransferase [Pontiellaceae bacterium]|nr:class I SAM-dependent methyltransferase [Pontiellaceae bacterium]